MRNKVDFHTPLSYLGAWGRGCLRYGLQISFFFLQPKTRYGFGMDETHTWFQNTLNQTPLSPYACIVNEAKCMHHITRSYILGLCDVLWKSQEVELYFLMICFLFFYRSDCFHLFPNRVCITVIRIHWRWWHIMTFCFWHASYNISHVIWLCDALWKSQELELYFSMIFFPIFLLVRLLPFVSESCVYCSY